MKAFACLLVAALALAGSAGSAEASVGCGVRHHAIVGIAGSRVLDTKGDVLVYRVRHPEFDTYWACSPRDRRRVLMGRDDSYQMRYELYGPTKAFGQIGIAGDWVTAIHEQDNSPECGKYGEVGCEGRSTTLVIVNLVLALRARENIYFPESEPARWLLSPQGGVAWLSVTEDELDGCAAEVLEGRLSCRELSLWSGHINPSSIHLSGRTLTWTATDGLHSAAI